MSANRIFLVCSHHPSPEDALCLAVVGLASDGKDRYFPAAACRCHGDCPCAAEEQERVNQWFKKHAHCGPNRGRDHFQIAYNRPQDWDLSPPAENTTAGAVKLALVNGSKHEN